MAPLPIVTVLMPAFNAETFIGDAVRSILEQTYPHFELLVIDDGSTDDTAKVVESFRDPRVGLMRVSPNRGLAFARNVGLDAASGELIAWLDSDDRSEPRRLEKQVEFFTRRPKLGLCGAWAQTFFVGPSRTWRYPRLSKNIKCHMLFDDPFATSSVMLRRSALPSSPAAFRDEYAPAEDYDLWERMSHDWETANIPRVLTHYRLHANQTSTRHAAKQRDAIERIQRRQLAALGLAPSSDEWRVHSALGSQWGAGLEPSDVPSVDGWIDRLREANRTVDAFPRKAFESVLKHRRVLVLNHLKPRLDRRLLAKLRTVRS